MTTKIIAIISRERDIISKVTEYLLRNITETIILKHLDSHIKAEQYLEKLMSMDYNTAIVLNTICSSFMKSIIDSVYVVNFCLSQEDVSSQNTIIISPYILLVKTIVSRFRHMFTNIEEINIDIILSRNDLYFLSTIHEFSPENILQLILTSLSRIGTSNYNVILSNNNETTISISSIGILRGYKDNYIIIAKLKYETINEVNSYIWQLLSLISLLNHIIIDKKPLDVDTKIALDEGVYSLFFSKLIEYGGEYLIDIQLKPL